MCTIFSTDAGVWLNVEGRPSPVPCHCHQEWHHLPCPSLPPPFSSPKPHFTQAGTHPPLCWLLHLSGCRETGMTESLCLFAVWVLCVEPAPGVLREALKPSSSRALMPGRRRRWGRIRSSYFSPSQLATDLAVTLLYVLTKLPR